MSKLDDRKTPNIKGMGGQLGSVSPRVRYRFRHRYICEFMKG